MEARQIVVAARSFGRAEPEGARLLEEAGYNLVYLPGKLPVAQELLVLMQQEATIAVIAGGDAITGDMIKSSPNLKIIAMHGVGLSHIDQQTADACGVSVKAVPAGNAEAVADLTWGLMFAVARHISTADAAVRRGEWGKFIGHSLNDKVLGIVGFGAIGKAVARRAAGFNMPILAYDLFPDQATAQELNAEYVSLDSLLSQADFITLHVPLTDDTHHLINASSIDKMKPTAILINVSRGDVIDEFALCQALQENRLGGAGLDVFSQEPLPPDHCLQTATNCVLTPHIGGRTRETIRHIGIATAHNILSVIG